MIQNVNELEICKRRLQKLQAWAQQIEQIQQEIQNFEWRDYPWYLEDGKKYEFCFLRIDIVEHSKLVESNPDELMDDTLNAFAEVVDLLVQNHDGKIWSWAGDGGLVGFLP
jgi:class 3 adenylate cyclase